MREKFNVSLAPLGDGNANIPDDCSGLIALITAVASAGTLLRGRPTRRLRSAGAAMTVPALSMRNAMMPRRPLRSFMIFDIQPRSTPATMTRFDSGLTADTG